jgi:hypothetical protein
MRHIHADHMIAAANDTSIQWEQLSSTGIWIGDNAMYWWPKRKYRQKPSPHPHQALIDQATADPSIVWQIKDLKGRWEDCYGNAHFQVNCYYRQKPAEPKMVDMWLWAITSDCGDIYTSDLFHSTKEDAQDYNTKNIICCIEGSKITVEVSQ